MTKPEDDAQGRQRWDRVEALFDAVYDLPPNQRADALYKCDDTAIRNEVASLLAEEGSVPPIVDSVAVRVIGVPDELSRAGSRVGAWSWWRIHRSCRDAESVEFDREIWNGATVHIAEGELTIGRQPTWRIPHSRAGG